MLHCRESEMNWECEKLNGAPVPGEENALLRQPAYHVFGHGHDADVNSG